MAWLGSMSTDQLDRSARDHFLASLDTSVPAAFDDDGKKIVLSGSDRMSRINRNSKVIASSDSLSMAIVRLLQEHGVEAEQHPLMTDPASGAEQVRVLGVRVAHGDQQVVAPIVPGAEVVRFYATTADGAIVPNDVVAELKPAVEPVDAKDPRSRSWASAQAIVAVVRAAFVTE
jgi:hypothetical protein